MTKSSPPPLTAQELTQLADLENSMSIARSDLETVIQRKRSAETIEWFRGRYVTALSTIHGYLTGLRDRGRF